MVDEKVVVKTEDDEEEFFKDLLDIDEEETKEKPLEDKTPKIERATMYCEGICIRWV